MIFIYQQNRIEITALINYSRTLVEIVDKLGVDVENLAWLLKKGRLVLGKSMQGSRKNLVWFLEEGYLVWK